MAKPPKIRGLGSFWAGFFCKGREKHVRVGWTGQPTLKACSQQRHQSIKRPHRGEILRFAWRIRNTSWQDMGKAALLWEDQTHSLGPQPSKEVESYARLAAGFPLSLSRSWYEQEFLWIWHYPWLWKKKVQRNSEVGVQIQSLVTQLRAFQACSCNLSPFE